MKIKNTIPQVIIDAASAMLKPWCEELTPTALVKAIENYQTDDAQAATDGVDRMLTLRQSAKLLQTSLPTIYRMEKQGKIRFVHFGERNVRIPYSEIARILEINE